MVSRLERCSGPSPVLFLALAALLGGCAGLARDPFPGSFRAGVLNDRREELFARPTGEPVPRPLLASAAATGETPEPRLPALPSDGVARPAGAAQPTPAVDPGAGVPPWPPVTTRASARRTASGALPLATPPAIEDAPLVPARAEPGAAPRRRAAPARLAAWLRHGENPALRRARIAAFAASLVGARKVVASGRRYAGNCSDFVRAVYSIEGIDLYRWPLRPAGFWGVRGQYGLAQVSGGLHFRKKPEVGDLVFFHHTYDANRNRRIDDYLSHVGVVEKVDGDGTVHYLDYAGGRVKRGRLNVRQPYRWREPQSLKQLNSYLRRRRKTDPPGTRYLAGELFAGFGTLLR